MKKVRNFVRADSQPKDPLPPWLANYTLVSHLHRYIDAEEILSADSNHVEV